MFTLRNSLSESVNIAWIEEGFTSKISLSSHSIETEGGLVEFFDDGSQYDKISAKFTAIVDQADMQSLENLYNNSRDGDFTLLTNGTRGFSLFTPAFGDAGDFIFKISSMKQSGALNKSIYKYFRVSFDVLAVSPFPSYSPISTPNEGKITLGSIPNLRYPINDFAVNVKMDASAVQTGYGVAYANDFEEQNERTTFTLRLLHDKMSQLIKYLIINRHSGMTMIVPSEVYPFGAKQGNFTTFNTRMLNKSLIVKQVKNKRYDLTLELQRLSSE